MSVTPVPTPRDLLSLNSMKLFSCSRAFSSRTMAIVGVLLKFRSDQTDRSSPGTPTMQSGRRAQRVVRSAFNINHVGRWRSSLSRGGSAGLRVLGPPTSCDDWKFITRLIRWMTRNKWLRGKLTAAWQGVVAGGAQRAVTGLTNDCSTISRLPSFHPSHNVLISVGHASTYIWKAYRL